MNELLTEIKKVDLEIKQNFNYSLDEEFKIVSSHLNTKEQSLLNQDIERFNKVGKFVIQNTFCGGIIFLKVAESIEKIKIEADCNLKTLEASVEYKSSKREKENIKFKPEVGKTEIEIWDVKKIFPNFFKYDSSIQYGLLLIIGKIVKKICEYGKNNLAHMNFINDFLIDLILKEGEKGLKLRVRFESDG